MSSIVPFERTFPVEIVGRILSFALGSPSDDPHQRPSPRPHPVAVLLVCKDTTRIVLPHFYRTINIFKPTDWAILFDPDRGVLGLDEQDVPESARRFSSSLAARRGWVHELFLGMTDRGPVDPFVSKSGLAQATVDWTLRLSGGDEPDWDSLPFWLARFVFDPWGESAPAFPRLITLIAVTLPLPSPQPVVHPALKSYLVQLHRLRPFPSKAALWSAWMTGDAAAVTVQAHVLHGFLKHSRIRTVHFAVDHTLVSPGILSPAWSVYKKLSQAELFAYLPVDGSTSFFAGRASPVDVLDRFLLGGPASRPTDKNTILVGAAEAVRAVLGHDTVRLAELKDRTGWEWLGPDGVRRKPLDALSTEHGGR